MTLVKTFTAAVLYAALALGANPVLAGNADIAAISALRAGDMRKMAFHKIPRDAVMTAFLDKNGNETDISAYAGKIVLLNLWATWCGPCRVEMPALDALQKDMGGDDFQVVTIATGRNPVPIIERFFEQTGVTALPILRDPTQKLARKLATFGLPLTLILDRQGREIARLRGDAEWDSPDAKVLLKALMDQTKADS